MDTVKGSAVIMGRVDTVDDCDDAGTVVSYNRAVLIQFDSVEDMRRAIEEGRCEFVFNPCG